MTGQLDLSPQLAQPPYWLVFGLPWPAGQEPAREAVAAIAPPLVTRDTSLPRDVGDVLAMADAYQRMSGGRVVFLSDLTKWLDQRGSSWAARGTGYEGALAFLLGRQSSTPLMYLTITQRAHVIICDASREGVTLHFTNGAPPERVSTQERQLVHQVLEQQLVADWPPYMRQLAAAGRLRAR
ncbi:hypothetical protein [Actinoplanes sp. NBRC 103695]|uniref:hypothetical protein n=1 Tax=Actinoplanes sp. NBRC 103695 TaxID=3032202 RepID=UPI0024A209AE|nr:hypothetical protein [Actinoplanes sp. NBRC 103695]GLZ01947.1 hypothetical protein Acsp02_91980 [Actinoplanes sp. NBRC 103695]